MNDIELRFAERLGYALLACAGVAVAMLYAFVRFCDAMNEIEFEDFEKYDKGDE